MSEHSMRTQGGSKKTVVREALIKKARKFLHEVKSEEAKLISQVQQLAKPAEESFAALVENKDSPVFKQIFADCLVTLQDTLSSIQDVLAVINEDSIDSMNEDMCIIRPADEDLTIIEEGTPSVEPFSTAAEHLNIQEELSSLAVGDQQQSSVDNQESLTEEEITPLAVVEEPETPQTTTSTRSNSELYHQSLQKLYKAATVKLDNVTEVTCGFHQGPNYLWLHMSPTVVERVAENICLGLSNNMYPALTTLPSIGDVVLAQYDVDQFFYRAVVKEILEGTDKEKVEVFFMDYGNVEVALLSSLLEMGEDLLTIPPQAILCSLDGVVPPVGPKAYSNAAMQWFEGLVSDKLKVRLSLCDNDCPILLASLYSYGNNVTTEMIKKGFALTMSTDEFKNNYANMTEEMKSFYCSLQPLYVSKKEKIQTPTRLQRSHSGSPAAKSSSSVGGKKFSRLAEKPLNMLPAEFAKTAEAVNSKTVSESQIKTRLLILKNEKRLRDDIVTDMITKPNEDSVEKATPTHVISASVPTRHATSADVPSKGEVTNRELFTSEQPAEDNSSGKTSQSKEKKSLVNGETLQLLQSVITKLSGPDFQQPDVTDVTGNMKTKRVSVSSGPQSTHSAAAAAQRMICHALGLKVTKCVGSSLLAVKTENASHDNRSQNCNMNPDAPDFIPLPLSNPQVKDFSDLTDSKTSDNRTTPEKPEVNDDPLNFKQSVGTQASAASKCPNVTVKAYVRGEWRETDDSMEVSKVSQSAVTDTCKFVSNKLKEDIPATSGTYSTPRVSSVSHPSKAAGESPQPVVCRENDPEGVVNEVFTQPEQKEDNPRVVDHSAASSASIADQSLSKTLPTTEVWETTAQTTAQASAAAAANCNVHDTDKQTDKAHTSAPTNQQQIKVMDGSRYSLPDDSISNASLGGHSRCSELDISPFADSTADSPPGLPNDSIACQLVVTPPESAPLESALPELSPPESAENTLQCLMSPLQCKQSVPAQILEISDTKEARRVLISHVDTPTDFYVNICDKKTAGQFSEVLEGIEVYYDRLYNSMLRTMIGDYTPQLGAYCVAKSDQFGSYYRAEIINFRESKDVVIDDVVVRRKNSKTIKVFFIDYGSSEWVSSERVFPLMPQFSGVPPLAWQCCLTDIYPMKGSEAEFPGGWNKNAVDVFNSVVPEGSVCDMYITNPRCRMVSEILQVILEIPAADGKETVFVNQKIVELNAAHSLYLHGEPSTILQSPTISSQPSTADLEQLEPPTPPDEDIESWKPMAEDFFSSTNMYSLDPNDAEVVLTGYKSQEQTKLKCKEYARRGHCSRGDACHFEHILEREGAITEDRKEVICTDVTISLPVVGSYAVVELTATVSPAHFYVKFPFGSKSIHEIVEAEASDAGSTQGAPSNPDIEAIEEDFSEFQQNLNNHYKSAPYIRNDAVAYAAGEILVAKFSEDNTFYRARVVDSDFDNHRVKAFFVDFGNSEWTAHSDVREMLPRFLHLPFQAVECFLPIQPVDPDKGWTYEETEYFNQMADGKFLICKPLYCNQGANCMTVELLDATSGKDVWLAQQMIDANIAKKSETPVKPVSPPSSLEDVKISPYLPG